MALLIIFGLIAVAAAISFVSGAVMTIVSILQGRKNPDGEAAKNKSEYIVCMVVSGIIVAVFIAAVAAANFIISDLMANM